MRAVACGSHLFGGDSEADRGFSPICLLVHKGLSVKAAPVPTESTRESRALASAVRELRARRKVTQEDLSTSAGFGIHYVSQLERGYHSASWVSVAKLAAALDVPLAEVATVYEARLRDGA